jgi:L-ascorbate metabolism protein UlaG (beta-lactamase superfamily)
MRLRIEWLGHASFRVLGSRVVYFDPWDIPEGGPSADLVVVSHHHMDHCSSADVAKIRTPKTVIVSSHKGIATLGAGVPLRPHEQHEAEGIAIAATAAYNIDKYREPGVLFHSPEDGGLGFTVTLDGQRIFHAGDTDLVPEMRNVRADIALLPVSGVAVMGASEAVEAARLIRPRRAIPMHYGKLVYRGGTLGTLQDAEQFCREYGEGAEMPTAAKGAITRPVVV